jgi:cardiolipin synthase
MQGGALYEFFRRVLAALRRIGWPKAAARLAPREADGYAVAIAYMLKARLWTLLRGEPRWPEVQRAWSNAAGHIAVEARDGLAARLHAEDRVQLIASGVEGFAAREALYAGAQRTLDIATYYIQSDETGRATVRSLAACVARGVRVRLLVDRYMMFKKTVEVEGMAALADEIRAAGIDMRAWHDPARPYDSNHRKMILADDRSALVGGRNFADHYRGDAWRDVDLVVEGPSVAPLASLFGRLWDGRARDGKSTPWVEATPDTIRGDPLMGFALAAVALAQRTVDLELAYFVAHDSLCGALERAARRGVAVRLLTNSAETNDLPYATWTAYEGIRRMLEAGVAVRGRRGAGRTLHPKYIVVDGEWVSFGSHNLDYYSPRYCGEVNLVVRDPGLGARLCAFFETGLAEATPIDLEGEVLPFLASHGSLRLFDRVFRDFQ